MGVKILANDSSKTKKNTPKVGEMVKHALKTLSDRQGSSLVAIKKSMAALFNVDPVKMATHIKKFIKTSLQNGALVQTKGNGASGSFKLGKVPKESKSEKSTPTQSKKSRKKKPKMRTPARKSLFQTPVPGKPKPKAREFAVPIPPSPFLTATPKTKRA